MNVNDSTKQTHVAECDYLLEMSSILATLSSAPADAAAAALFSAPAVQYGKRPKRSASAPSATADNSAAAASKPSGVEPGSGSSGAAKKRRKGPNPEKAAAKIAAVAAAAKAASLLGIKSDPSAVKKENLRARSMSSAASSDGRPGEKQGERKQPRAAPAKAKPKAQGGRPADPSSSAAVDFDEEVEAASAADGARLARTIFVGNVPPATRRAMVAKHFGTFGAVESVYM